MFYISAALLILKSYYDRFLSKDSLPEDTLEITEEQRELCAHSGYKIRDETNRTILSTIDQLPFIRERVSESVINILFWINLVANTICMNVVFLSEVFVMVFVSIVYHAFAFIHKQIDKLLGNPDTIFSINVVHEPTNIEDEADKIVKKELKAQRGVRSRGRLIDDLSFSVSISPNNRPNYEQQKECSITIRALWEQMEELIDLLEQINHVFGMTLQFLSLEYLLLFPALLYFAIELYPTLSAISIIAFLSSFFILGLRSFIFTYVCARVNKEAVAPISTLYRAYLKVNKTFTPKKDPTKSLVEHPST